MIFIFFISLVSVKEKEQRISASFSFPSVFRKPSARAPSLTNIGKDIGHLDALVFGFVDKGIHLSDGKFSAFLPAHGGPLRTEITLDVLVK